MNPTSGRKPENIFTAQDAIDRVREHNERRIREVDEAFRSTLATVNGRRCLAAIIHALAQAGGGTFEGNGPRSFYNEGRRSVGVELELNMKAASRDLHKMLVVEQLEREAEDEKQLELARKADEVFKQKEGIE